MANMKSSNDNQEKHKILCVVNEPEDADVTPYIYSGAVVVAAAIGGDLEDAVTKATVSNQTSAATSSLKGDAAEQFLALTGGKRRGNAVENQQLTKRVKRGVEETAVDIAQNTDLYTAHGAIGHGTNTNETDSVISEDEPPEEQEADELPEEQEADEQPEKQEADEPTEEQETDEPPEEQEANEPPEEQEADEPPEDICYIKLQTVQRQLNMGWIDIATKLIEVLEELINKARRIEQLHGVNVETRELLTALIQHKSSAEKLIEKIRKPEKLEPEKRKKLEDEIKILRKKVLADQQRIDELEKELREVKSELKGVKSELKEMKQALETGQLAYDFEKDLAQYIYPTGKKIGSKRIFTTMKNWLVEKKETPQGREANEKWERLKVEFSWSRAHEAVFFKLIKDRLPVAHPDFKWETFMSQSRGSFTDEEKKCIESIYNMTKRVNELMYND